jgi:hypothetical protein
MFRVPPRTMLLHCNDVIVRTVGCPSVGGNWGDTGAAAIVDWYRGYGATIPCAPRAYAIRPCVRRHLVPSIISRGALCQATLETSVSEERSGREVSE